MSLKNDMAKTLCLLMAGGRGERLYPLTKDFAKPSVRFGGIYRIVDFTLSNCLNSNIRPFLHPRAHAVSIRVSRSSHSLRVEYIQSRAGRIYRMHSSTAEARGADGTAEPGTASSRNIDILQAERPERVLILSGDHIYKMDYNDMLAVSLKNDADPTVAGVEVDLAEASAFGVIGCDENYLITSWEEKPEHPSPVPGKPDKAFVSMGVYIFNTNVSGQDSYR